jgi:hypothetical protein
MPLRFPTIAQKVGQDSGSAASTPARSAKSLIQQEPDVDVRRGSGDPPHMDWIWEN